MFRFHVTTGDIEYTGTTLSVPSPNFITFYDPNLGAARGASGANASGGGPSSIVVVPRVVGTPVTTRAATVKQEVVVAKGEEPTSPSAIAQ
jgi:hypothetical protein